MKTAVLPSPPEDDREIAAVRTRTKKDKGKGEAK